MDEMRLKAQRKKEKAAEYRKTGKPGSRRTSAELYVLKNQVAEDYMRAPIDDRPTPAELSEKYGVPVNTVRKWYNDRGFRTKVRKNR